MHPSTGSASDSPLRDALRTKNRDLATLADALWIKARTIHIDQARKDGNASGSDHVQTVEDNIWKLLAETYRPAEKESYLESLTAHDLFLLSLSACCHDFDKAVRDELLRKTFEHGEGSADIVMKAWGALGLTSKHVARYVAEIVSIHDCKENFQGELERISAEYSLGNRSGDLRRLALLLKAADTLHCDHTRVYDRGMYGLDPAPEFRDKGLAREAISGWRIKGTAIWIDAYIDSDESARAFCGFQTFFNEKEWKPLASLLERYGFPFEVRFNVKGHH